MISQRQKLLLIARDRYRGEQERFDVMVDMDEKIQRTYNTAGRQQPPTNGIGEC